MRKLTLKVEDLSVESFQPLAGAETGTGTVRAHQETWPFRCTQFCTYNCTGIPCFSAQRPC